MYLRTLFASVAIASSALAATSELRGTWVTTTSITAATSTVYNRAAVNTNFARLRAIGLNTVYMDAWRAGTSYFPSKTVQQVTGQLMASDTGGRDLFGDTLLQAHRNGMSQFAWLQYGFATEFSQTNAPTNALSTYMKNKGWLLKDSSGAYSNSTFKYAWMNPLVPEVRQFVINMGIELVRKYDLDGIQFDDRLAWPVQFGYDDYTKATYFAETGKALPANPSDAAFIAWRATKVTAFAKEFSAAIRAENPKVLVAATPGVYGYVYNNYCVDSPQWTRENTTVNGVTKPLFDEVVPQVYNSALSGFKNDWDYQLQRFDSADRATYGAGISINNSAGGPYAWSLNQSQADYQRNTTTGTKGQIWWYSDGVLNSDEANMTAYYNVAANGQAERPDRPAGWRPAPTVATAAGAGKWLATIGATDRYQIVTRTTNAAGDIYAIAFTTVLPAGTLTLNVGGNFASVEVIVDRRGFTYGDADLDGRVDLTDFFALQRNFNASGATWAQGDFTFDGLVNAADLNVMAQFWGVGTTPGSLPSFASLVPEPAALTLLASGTLVMRRRRST